MKISHCVQMSGLICFGKRAQVIVVPFSAKKLKIFMQNKCLNTAHNPGIHAAVDIFLPCLPSNVGARYLVHLLLQISEEMVSDSALTKSLLKHKSSASSVF